MGTAGRPTKLTPEVRAIISHIHRRHLDWGVRIIEEKIPQFSESIIKRKLCANEVPGRTVISKYLRILAPKIDEIEKSGIDARWEPNTLAKYPIPSDAIPYVLSSDERCWHEAITHEDKYHRWVEENFLTVREALWISRLYKVLEFSLSKYLLRLKDPKEGPLLLSMDMPPEGYQNITVKDIILDWAYTFAQEEKCREIDGDDDNIYRERAGHIIVAPFEVYGERQEEIEEELNYQESLKNEETT
jgi:hypothetical protein